MNLTCKEKRLEIDAEKLKVTLMDQIKELKSNLDNEKQNTVVLRLEATQAKSIKEHDSYPMNLLNRQIGDFIKSCDIAVSKTEE